MTSAGPSVVWICGAPGAGKSVAAWALVERLTGDGQRVAYVDIDQLGMLYPAADDDPQRHQFKAEAPRELGDGKPVTIGADDSVDEILRTMTEHAVRRLPVIDGDRLVGIVSQADVAKNLPEDKVGDLVSAISAGPANG